MNASIRRGRAGIRVIVFVLLLLIGAAAEAGAHAYLERSVPLQDAELKESPEEIRIQFTENIDTKLSTMLLEDEKGSKVRGELRAENGNTLILKIGTLSNGVYKVKWQVLSVDTHVTEGSFRFSVGAPLEKQRPSDTISLDGAAAAVPPSAGSKPKPAEPASDQASAGADAAVGNASGSETTPPLAPGPVPEPVKTGQAEPPAALPVPPDNGTAGRGTPPAEDGAGAGRKDAAAPAPSKPDPSVGQPVPAPSAAGDERQKRQSDEDMTRSGQAADNSAVPGGGDTGTAEALPDGVREAVKPPSSSSFVAAQADAAEDAMAGSHVHRHGSDDAIEWRSVIEHTLRIVDVLAVTALAGFLFFRDIVWGGRRERPPVPFTVRNEKRLAMLAAAALLLAGAIQVWMLAERLSESGMYPIGDRAKMIVSSTLYGQAAWLRPLGALFLLLLCYAPERDRRWAQTLKYVCIAGLALTFPLTGHAVASASGAWLAGASHFVHMLAAAVWFGGLAGLFASTIHARGNAPFLPELDALIRRFSAYALPVIGIVALSGAWLSVIRLRHWADLLYTSYGRLAAIKIALLLGIFAIAAFHRLRFMPRIRAVASSGSALERAKALRGFLFGVRAEIVLATVLFVLAGILSTSPPPASGSGMESVYWHEMGEKAHMSLRIQPEGERHSYRVDVWLPSGIGTPAEIGLLLEPTEANSAEERIEVPLSYVEGGPDPYGFEGFHKYTYEAVGNFLAERKGRWDIFVFLTNSLNEAFSYRKTIRLP